MHRYFPHTPEDEARMLEAVGAKKVEDLFASIPEPCRRTEPLRLSSMTEWELVARAEELASSMPGAKACWFGAGSYDHYIPALVHSLISRSEFSTAYTPYQPEIAQGTLQMLFEFQTQVARLLGTDVANASMYDGSTACWEAIGMARRITRKSKAILSSGLHPHYVSVAKTMAKYTGDMLETALPALSADTAVGIAALAARAYKRDGGKETP